MRTYLSMLCFVFGLSTGFSQTTNWLLGHEITMDVKLTNVEHGDMSTYVTFEPLNFNKESTEITFAYWTMELQEASIDIINKVMNYFEVANIGDLYRITVVYKKIEELEYTFSDEGNVKTGTLINEWVLIKIITVE